jgi:hypothetical protein
MSLTLTMHSSGQEIEGVDFAVPVGGERGTGGVCVWPILTTAKRHGLLRISFFCGCVGEEYNDRKEEDRT